jgi:hypothetical protein
MGTHFRLSCDAAIHPELVAELEKGAPRATAQLPQSRVTAERRSAGRAALVESVRSLFEASRALGETALG